MGLYELIHMLSDVNDSYEKPSLQALLFAGLRKYPLSTYVILRRKRNLSC